MTTTQQHNSITMLNGWKD